MNEDTISEPDHYHQTNPPCELKSVVLGRQGSKKSQKQSDSETDKRRSSSACSLSVSDAEAIMCVAMLGSSMDHWLPILQRYNEMMQDPIPILEALNRRNPKANVKNSRAR